MPGNNSKLISVVVPLYNEEAGIKTFNDYLFSQLKLIPSYNFEVIYVDDGSDDNTAPIIKDLSKNSKGIKLLKLSRNFGKENALTAGISAAKGDAIITMDGDSQHPANMIPEFIKRWHSGSMVVVGIRQKSKSDTLIRKSGSKIFYKTFNAFGSQTLIPGSTDFRLIDKSVQAEFIKLKETGRITRGLIDWLGFSPSYITFDANDRLSGSANYSFNKLAKLAMDSFVSSSPVPLFIFGIIGFFITTTSFLLGLLIFIEQLLLNDPWHLKFTGTAMLALLILFLVGLILMSQGIISVYLSHIHSQSKQRPLYIIDYQNSDGIDKD